MYLPLLIYLLEKLISIVKSIYFILFSISIISINTSEYYQYQPLYQNPTSNRSFHVSYFDSLSVLMGQDFSLVLLISPTISNFENYPPPPPPPPHTTFHLLIHYKDLFIWVSIELLFLEHHVETLTLKHSPAFPFLLNVISLWILPCDFNDLRPLFSQDTRVNASCVDSIMSMNACL